MALHASRSARERFGLRGRAEFAGGKIVLRTAAAARGLAAALREVDEGTREVSAGELNALARV